MKNLNAIKECLRKVSFLLVCLLAFSCIRNSDNDVIDEGNLKLGDPISVKINFLGSVWEKEISENIQSLENEDLSSSQNYMSSNVSDKNLHTGTKYEIIAYKENAGKYFYQKQQTFTVGEPNPSFTLGIGESYVLIAYSAGKKNIKPFISVINQNNFQKASFVFQTDLPNSDILYQKIEFKPDGKNSIDVKLKNKVSKSRIVLDASDFYGGYMGKNITSVTNAKISYERPELTEIKLSSGEQLASNKSKTVTVNLGGFGKDSKKLFSDYVDNIIVEKGTNVIFTADVDVSQNSGEKKHINLFLKNIKSGYKSSHIANIKLNCGAYLGPNNTDWREFMCYNLNADTSFDPFKPQREIRGDLYTWDGYIVKPELLGNSRMVRARKYPCPSGYREPSIDEWERVFSYNKITPIGDFEGSEDYSGVRLGDRLVLPSTGFLAYEPADSQGGIKYSDTSYGNRIYYWSSTNHYNIRYHCCGVNYDRQKENRILGQAVRCMKN